MYEEVHTIAPSRRRLEVPHYWGHGNCAFIVDTPTSAVRVAAVPMLEDEPIRLAGADHVVQAQRWIGATRFDEAADIVGAIGSAFSTLNAIMTDEDGDYLRNWKRRGTTRTSESLLLEETVIPVGATVSVSGPWSVAQRAIVAGASHPGAPDGAMAVSVTTGDIDNVISGQSVVPPSKTYTIVFAIVMAALGCGVLWGGLAGFAQGL